MYNECFILIFFFKQKVAYEIRISDWSADVCSSDLILRAAALATAGEKKQLSLNLLGSQLAIPKSEHLFRAAEHVGGLPIIKEMRQGYAKAFGSPAASLSEDALRYARAQEIGRASCRERVCKYVSDSGVAV